MNIRQATRSYEQWLRGCTRVIESELRSKHERMKEDLLLFLNGEGRSNANCWAADLFFANSEGWEGDWAEQNLPEGFHDVLAMMGEALHDTVQAPEIAKNFGCLPEQLLEWHLDYERAGEAR